MMRSDIPHGGVENFSQHDHHILHTFVKVKDWNNLGWDTKYNVKNVMRMVSVHYFGMR